MSSITTWVRLEPRPRAPSIAPSLAARIRDPLWMLTRQWQVGEFRGEDAGAPAFVQLSATTSKFTGWRAQGQNIVQPITGEDPLEDLVESEPFTPDLTTRVELGQLFEAFLATRLTGASRTKVAKLGDAIRHAYQLPPLPGDVSAPPLLNVALGYRNQLDKQQVVSTTLVKAFATGRVVLSKRTLIVVITKGSHWQLIDPDYARHYIISWAAPQNMLSVRLEAPPELAADLEAARFWQVCSGRTIDGVPILRAASTGLAILPSTIVGTLAGAVRDAGEALRRWVVEVYGEVGVADPPAWVPERLEYAAEVVASTPDGGTANFATHPARDGAFGWEAFDVRKTTVGAGQRETISVSIVPSHVRFRGMPNARWWDFESGTTAFGEIQPDKRDVAKLVLMDFMLVHGNDWFLVPLYQPTGSLCRIDTLIVHDVFGIDTLVERADAAAAPPDERWTLFSTSIEGMPANVADFFILPPTAATAAQVGPTTEEVRFLRDEMANMVWGVEHVTENGVGEPWPGQERDLGRNPAPSPPATGGNAGAPALRYVLETTVPENWIPFLPVAVDPLLGTIMLERSFMTRDVSGAPQDVLPMGRILSPSNLTQPVYRIFEEEAPREGARVLRTIMRSRWIDGSTHLWIARRKVVGTGGGSSGLRFDLAVPSRGVQSR